MPDLELTFMGTGTSHGVPVIGCACPVCHSTDPRDRRLRSAARIEFDGKAIQIDTPPDFRTQCLRGGYASAEAVIYTHSHMDHMIGFDDLRRFCELSEREIPVYGAPAVLADLKRIFPYAFDEACRGRTYVRPAASEIRGPFDLLGLRVVPVELPHGRTTTTGLIFSREGRRRLAYFTDCQSVPREAEEAARGCDVLVIDALRHSYHPTHMTVASAIEAARRIGARRTYFTHMCHELAHAETEAALPPEIRLSYDGLKISL